jgi:hypothetical protein
MDLFQKAGSDEQEIADILTNMLACASNQDIDQIAPVERLLD